jgi:hypothetical protein
MVYFITKNPNLGKFRRALEWKILVYFNGHLGYITAIWDILLPFGINNGHLVFRCNAVYCPRPPILVYCITKNLATLESSNLHYDENLFGKQSMTAVKK